MNKLELYIAKTVMLAVFFMILMLTGLQIFILFVNQLNDIGKENFGVLQAFFVVLLQTPYQIYLFFPMASLLGCLLGLGMLANNRELIIMRASGMSINKIGFAVVKASLLLVLVVTFIGEFYIPKLTMKATELKLHSLSKGKSLQTEHSLWVKDHNDFFHIDMMITPKHLEDVVQFHINDSYELSLVRQIQKLILTSQGWVGFNIAETRFSKGRVSSKTIVEQSLRLALDTKMLDVSFLEPDEMDFMALKSYINSTSSVKFAYKLAYWQRIMQPFTTLVMMWLAIPFIFGPLRSSTMGYKFLIGALIGFGFYIINKFCGSLSIVLQWPAYLVASIPTILFFILGTYIMQRVR